MSHFIVNSPLMEIIMKTKYQTGNTAFNDGLLLPSGMISIDDERKALRFHDGSTVGGYEILGEQAYNPPIPGPQVLKAGDMQLGFFGETSSAELLTYEALATQIGLSAGTSQHTVESLWLKFALDGKILYVAKKPARHTVSWNDINAAQAVFGETTTLVGSHTLKVRLLTGASSNPTTDASGWDIPTSHGSEWNRLLYPIHSGIHTEAANPATHGDPTAAPFGSWASYSDADLVVHRDQGDGSYSWIQETPATTAHRVYRGSRGVSLLNRNTATLANAHNGWRPVLELVV